MRIAAITTGGKDSLFAAYKASEGNELVCLIGEKSDNGPNIGLLELQAKAMNLPLITMETLGESIGIAKEKYKVEGVVSGVISDVSKKNSIENSAKISKVTCVFPLLEINKEIYLNELMARFNVILIGIDAEGLNEDILGTRVGLTFIDRMQSLNVDIVGEGGEFQTYVLECPLFKKIIKIEEHEIRMESENKGQYKIKKAILV
ncbi:MAG: hypothetical protein U9O94_06925 [Nanoarchaeota archaeon]|nr:hypothetical protein [Nanoarchaeota archaeon]